MMKETDGKPEIGKVAEVLFNFAIDREDVKWLMANLSVGDDTDRGKVEYELQILKIISVGWCISYVLEGRSRRGRLMELFWETVRDFSKNLSTAAGVMTGRDIDYFDVLKNRLDRYVGALKMKPDAPEPAAVIGPEFARICGSAHDTVALMTGAKMFMSTIGAVKEYLETTALP